MRCGIFACSFVSMALSLLVAPTGALASGSFGVGDVVAATDLSTVIGNLTLWLTGLLAGVATVFLIVGAVRYVMAGGDPIKHERAKGAISSAVLGYAFALFAPIVVTIIQQIVGG